MSLTIRNLRVAVGETGILSGLDLEVASGEIHAIMGPNGSGKSTLAFSLAGHPSYSINSGSISLDGNDITDASPEDRARAGLFLSFQHPVEIPGVSMRNFLRTAFLALYGEKALPEFAKRFQEALAQLGLPETFATRSINEGFSGGEKKRMEMVQLLTLRPKYAVLDETDSGLDVDAIKLVGNAIMAAKKNGCGILLITHYARLLTHVIPDVVHILQKGKITKTGDAALANEIERSGYEKRSD